MKNKILISTKRNFLYWATGIFIIFSSWAGLTKAGVIPNFLDVEILCAESKNTQFFEPEDELFEVAKKPVIYLYPETEQIVEVRLDYHGQLFATYPDYEESIKGWKVKASPDGKLINLSDNREYSYLFWEGGSDQKIDWDISRGFVVKGKDTKAFLQQKLAEIGLTPQEYNEFIVYWFPQMQENPYNLIHFAGEAYTRTAPLHITPEPDSVLRVFMVYKPLKEKIEVPPQTFPSFQREGFTVIEWGGSEIR